MFDFTSLFHAVNASRIVERNGKQILMALVGDSLLEVNNQIRRKNKREICFYLEFLANGFWCWSWFFRFI
jgi:hypothetical protein